MATVDRHGRVWRVRYVGPDGRRVVETGFRTEKTATDHGRRQEIAIADGSWVDPRQAHTCFSDYIDRWIAAQDLEPTTLATYRSLIRNQIKPSFGHWPTGDLDTTAVRTWIAGLRDAGFSESTVRAARRVLHTICEDAVAERLIVTNPARIPRRRGRVANRVSTNESLWAEPEQARAIAPRLRELTGRDDEYVLALTLAYTGIRWAEVVGLEATFCMPLGRNELRIEWQLAEVNGRFLRKEPKYGSVRTIPIPAFLSALLGEQLDRALRCEASDCGCGNRTYVFMGPDGGHPRRSNFARRYWRPVCDGYSRTARARAARQARPEAEPSARLGPYRCWPDPTRLEALTQDLADRGRHCRDRPGRAARAHGRRRARHLQPRVGSDADAARRGSAEALGAIARRTATRSQSCPLNTAHCWVYGLTAGRLSLARTRKQLLSNAIVVQTWSKRSVRTRRESVLRTTKRHLTCEFFAWS